MYTNGSSSTSGYGQNTPRTPPSQTGAAYYNQHAPRVSSMALPPSPYTPTVAQRGPYPQAPHIPPATLPGFDTHHGLLTPPASPARPRVYQGMNLHPLLAQPASAFYFDMSKSPSHIRYFNPAVQNALRDIATSPGVDCMRISIMFDTVFFEIRSPTGAPLTVGDVLTLLFTEMNRGGSGRLQKIAPAFVFNGLAQYGNGWSVQVAQSAH